MNSGEGELGCGDPVGREICCLESALALIRSRPVIHYDRVRCLSIRLMEVRGLLRP